MTTEKSIYEELLTREYGALALREEVGKNMLNATAIAIAMLWSLLVVLFVVNYLQQLHPRVLPDTGTREVHIIFDNPSIALPDRGMIRFVPPKVTEATGAKYRIIDAIVETPPSVLPVEVGGEANLHGDTGIGAGRRGYDSGVVYVPPTVVDTEPAMGVWVKREIEPEPISTVQPNYPELARSSGVRGVVIVNYLIDRTGRVLRAEIARATPSGLGFEEEALTAVKQWRFKPAINNGQPVMVWMTQQIRFTLR